MRNSYGATPETLVQLSQKGIIWGVKQASANPTDFRTDCQQMFALDPTIKLYTGSDTLIKEFMFDGVYGERFYGLTSIVGNIFPKSLALMIADFVANTDDNQVNNELGLVTNHNLLQRQQYLKETSDTLLVGCTLPVGVKYGLKIINIQAGETRRPIGFLTDEKKAQIEAGIKKFHEFSGTY